MNWTEESINEIWDVVKRNSNRFRYAKFDEENQENMEQSFDEFLEKEDGTYVPKAEQLVSDVELVKVKVRAIGHKNKSHQRMLPIGCT